ncbi:hypothetical protein K490DRAFT_61178 [Saccharata proteae CBS 121410]|uniref:Uncharacterized protein n=1 Tax=Saccharata proteae CBS 121410 TaxID=1314787 RepID=A0A9P4M3D3_9PEZI|nr:hypothetical protein K490DRAFT_61178 [Saccharata proteae CBS 121410]
MHLDSVVLRHYNLQLARSSTESSKSYTPQVEKTSSSPSVEKSSTATLSPVAVKTPADYPPLEPVVDLRFPMHFSQFDPSSAPQMPDSTVEVRAFVTAALKIFSETSPPFDATVHVCCLQDSFDENKSPRFVAVVSKSHENADHATGYKTSPIPIATPCPRRIARADPSSSNPSRITGKGNLDGDVSNYVDGTSDNPSGARKPAECLALQPGHMLVASDPPSAFELEAKPAKSVRFPVLTPETCVPAPPLPGSVHIAPGRNGNGHGQGFPIKPYRPTSIPLPLNENWPAQRSVRTGISTPYSLAAGPANTRDGDGKVDRDQTGDPRRPKCLNVSVTPGKVPSESDSVRACSRSSQSPPSATNSSDFGYAPTAPGPWNGQSGSGALSNSDEGSDRFRRTYSSPGWSFMRDSQVKQSLKASSKSIAQSKELDDFLNSQGVPLRQQEQKKESTPPARYRRPTAASLSRHGVPNKTTTPAPTPTPAATKPPSEAREKPTTSQDAQPTQPIRRQKSYCDLFREQQISEPQPPPLYSHNLWSDHGKFNHSTATPFPGPETTSPAPTQPLPLTTMPGILGKHSADVSADTDRQYHHIMDCYAAMAKPTLPTIKPITPISLADPQHPYYQQFYDVMRCYQDASVDKPTVPDSIAGRGVASNTPSNTPSMTSSTATRRGEGTAAEEYRKWCDTISRGYGSAAPSWGAETQTQTQTQAPEEEACQTRRFENIMHEYQSTAVLFQEQQKQQEQHQEQHHQHQHHQHQHHQEQHHHHQHQQHQNQQHQHQQHQHQKQQCSQSKYMDRHISAMRFYSATALQQQRQDRQRQCEEWLQKQNQTLHQPPQHQEYFHPVPAPPPSPVSRYSLTTGPSSTPAPPSTILSTDDAFPAVMRSYTDAEQKTMDKQLMQKFVAEGGLVSLAEKVSDVEAKKTTQEDGKAKRNKNKGWEEVQDSAAPAVNLGSGREMVVDGPSPVLLEEWLVLGDEGNDNGVEGVRLDEETRREYDFIEEEDWREGEVRESLVF